MKKITQLLFCIIFLSFYKPATGQVVVNEVVSSNSAVNTDEDGTYQDWVELYNTGSSAVSLNGYGLTDDATSPFKWTFPNVTMPSHTYLLVWCSDKNRTVPGQPLHTNWKIGAEGEVITLTNPGGITADFSPSAAIAQNFSYGRLPNGTGSFVFFETPTPNAVNVGTSSGGELSPPVFSQNSGFFTTGFSLTLSTTEAGATIIYTLDGSEPDAANLGGTTYNYKNRYPKDPGQAFGPMLFKNFESQQYTAAIPIADRTSQPNDISTISSTYDFTSPYIPSANIFKGTVIRAKVVKPGFTDSPTITKNYFISPAGTARFTLPVISLSINENQLFDYEDGIYVAGKLFDDFRTDFPTEAADYPIGNYTQKGSAFERIANFNYFVNGIEILNQKIGIRVQGNYSRLYPSKSLNFYSKSEYGVNGMPYKFFADEPYTNFKNIVIKNSGSDFYNSFFKDALCAELAKPLHTQTEAAQPAITFINGEYWGLLTVREKYDDEFFLRVHGVPKNEIELLENDGSIIEEGTNTHYLAMVNYFETHSLVPQANYDYIRTQMDTESFIDYFATEIFMDNGDWPGNNIIFWRRNTPYNPNASYGNDGRWRWAVHDMSSTWDDYTENTLAVATEPNGPEFPNPAWSTLMLRKLLENPDFKYDFITRFADIMNTSFLSSRAIAKINEMTAEIAPEMAEQILRWKAPFEMDEWNYFVGERLDYAAQRPTYQRTHIRQEFGIANNINTTVNVSNAAHGYVKVNTIDIVTGTPGITAANPYPWTGVYFSNIPVKLKAVAKPGYMFSHWTGASAATTDEISISSAASFSVTAVFVPSGFAAETSIPVYFWMMNGTIPNDTPLVNLSSTYEVPADATINFQSSFAGYPFNASDPNWRKGSMERRNKPTPLNYRPEANGGEAYVANDVKGLQITQPFQIGALENTMVFNLPTVNYKNIKFSFAAIDEGAATGISIDYAVNAGAPVWITAGLAATSLPLTSAYQLFETDFTGLATVNNNANFKVRLRFTGPNMTASAGARVTFNNIALDGVRLPLTYPSPNSFPAGTAITNLTPTVAAAVTSYSISPGLPAGLSFDTSTGVISGTPTAITPTAAYTVTATNPGGTATFDVVIAITEPAPSALSYATPNVFTVSAAIAALDPMVTGNVTGYSVSPALPNGLSLDASTGVISGTPTVIFATATYTVTATNSGGNTSFGVVITVNDVAPGSLTYNSPNVFTVGAAIAALNPTVTGNVTGYSVSPALPNGLSLDASTGVISGTPTAVSATATYTVTATNSGGNTSFGVVITVNDVAPGSLTYNSPNVFTVGAAIAALDPTVTGNVTGYSVSPALPNGLVLDASTGVISGTPTAVASTATYTVTATNSGGNTSFGVVITVNDIAPSALSYTTPNVFTVGAAIAALDPTVTGNVTGYSVSPALPNGLVLDASTGVISGTPTAIFATATYIVTATNSGGNTAFGVVITVNDIAPSALSYTTPTVFTVGNIITSLNPTITGNVTGYSVSPALPNGLALDASTGIISGTPTVISATATYTVTATNSGGNTAFGVVITVNDVAPTALSYTTPNVFTVGNIITSLSPTITGNVTGYSVSPALPNGLSLDISTGIISGTPTAISATATYTVTATNSGGNTAFGVVITVNDVAPGSLTYNSTNVFTIGAAIAALDPTVTGNVTGYSVSPALPNGLALDASTGVISGTPTAVASTATYTVTATNSGGNTSFGVVITVNDIAPGSLIYNSPNVFTIGAAIAALDPTVTGNVTGYSVSPALPNGLSLDASTGVISGTPTAIFATATYTVTATNSGGNTSFGVVITVNDIAPGSLTYNSPNVFTVGAAIAALDPTVTGNVTGYSVSPALPNGLSLDASTGVISGTPTAVVLTATYTVTATNSGGNTSFGVVITVNDIAPSALSYTTPNVFTIGAAIAALNPTVTGNVTGYSVSPALPNGLVLDASTGVISGTPTAIFATATYIVTATNSGGNTSFGVVITVNDAAPSALSYTTPNVFTIDAAIAALDPTVTGNVTGYSVSPALPNGLSLDASTGVISGTPTAISATATYTVTATNSGGNTSFGVVITVNDIAPGSLTYNSPNVFTVGAAIAALDPTVTGNVTGYSVSPALPNGLSLDASTGVISGTPTAVSATATYTVTATNSGGNTSFGIVITVNDAAPTALSYTTPNVFTVGNIITSLSPTITGNVTGYSVSPALPNGLSLDASTGVISGTPTAVASTATYTVTATNSGGNTSFGVVITVNDIAPGSLTYNSPNVFTIGAAIAALDPTVTGNVTGYSVSPALPNGLSLDASTGVISGTPTAISATATYTVTATNSGGNTSFGVVITVNDIAPGSLTYNSPNVFTIGAAIAALNPTVTGNVTGYSVSPALPNGLSLDASTGVISGTPTAISATATYIVMATNSGGNTSFGVVITVNDAAPSALSYTTPNVFTIGAAIAALNPTVTGNVTGYSVSPALPNGLALDASTGVISGTPTAVSATATYTVTATNSGGNTSFGVIITINAAAPAGLSYPSPNVFTTGQPITSIQPTVSGGTVTNYSVSPVLPLGLTLDPATGVISGMPMADTATATFTVTATNTGGSTSFNVVITVVPPLGISENSLVFSIYPNPFTDRIYVAGITADVSYMLYGIDGKLIHSGKVTAGEIEFRELPNGMYLLQLSSEGKSVVKKIIRK